MPLPLRRACCDSYVGDPHRDDCTFRRYVTPYEDAGGDPTRCEFCNEKLDDSKPWTRGLDGAGAHRDCIERYVF